MLFLPPPEKLSGFIYLTLQNIRSYIPQYTPLRKMGITRKIVMLLVITVIAMTCLANRAHAATTNDAQADSILKDLRRHFNTTNKDSLYQTAARYRAHQLNKGDLYRYYQGWQYEILYEINLNNFYHAMRKTIMMSEDMKMRKENDMLYSATYLFGIIYSLQGNMEMAKKCFYRALEEGKHQPPVKLVNIYKELANVEMDDEPEKAMKNINRTIKIISQSQLKYEYSDAIGFKIIVAFMLKDMKLVKSLYKEYTQMQKDYGNEFSTTYYTYATICERAAEGKYGEALKWTGKLTGIDRYKFETIVHEHFGNTEKAFMAQKKYIHIKDSINSTIMVQELNDATNYVEMNAMRHKANKDRVKKKVMTMVIFGAAIIILILIFVILNRRDNMMKLKKKNSELEILRYKSEEAERFKSNILQNMSHEIRTPLNIISGFTQLICQPGFNPSDEEKAEIANHITASSDNLIRIINNLLYVAAKESESYASQKEDIAFNSLLSRLAGNYQQTLTDDVSFSFVTDIPDDFHFMSSTKGIETIFDNLLNNARKFTTNGSITLQCSFDERKEHVVISVTDTGTGVPEDQQEQIFSVFYKVDNSKEGLGTGLSLSRHIARQLGGDLKLDSSYHGGARFILTLPVKRK